MRKFSLLIVLVWFSTLAFYAQNKKASVYSVAFYNLENLFDTIHQPEVNDYEYLPNGGNRWGTFKYYNKLNNMASVLSQLGTEYCPTGPAVIGVSEIENQGVLEDLVKTGDLAQRGYKIVHYDSPDRRGVDVGLLYNPLLYKVDATKSSRLYMKDFPDMLTRDQLVVSGKLAGEKVHFIVNHWPSRLGGEKQSSPKREAAAALTKHLADSLLQAFPDSKVVIMGDLNDDPTNRSCRVILDAKRNQNEVAKDGLYNPFWKMLDKGIGSLAYQGNWNLFDQIIISSGFLGKDKTELKFWKAEVFNREFLKQQEGKYKGYPLRTHAGGVYLNGYSDHFPTIVYFTKEAK